MFETVGIRYILILSNFESSYKIGYFWDDTFIRGGRGRGVNPFKKSNEKIGLKT
jgi:hypothetical protein